MPDRPLNESCNRLLVKYRDLNEQVCHHRRGNASAAEIPFCEPHK
jgi:hypothetical protein